MDSKPILTAQEILRILPHRYPFLLVDKVIGKTEGPDPASRTGATLTAIKNITINEPFFTGHFPGLPVMPGVLQVEAMAQAACLAHYRKGDVPKTFFIASIQEAKFRKPVVPGDTLVLFAEVVKDRGSLIVVKTHAQVEGQTVAEAQIMAKIAKVTEQEI